MRKAPKITQSGHPRHPTTGPTTLTTTLATTALFVLGGCAIQFDGTPEPEIPEVTGISKNALSVGDDLEIMGHNFVDKNNGWVEVKFMGTFFPHDGSAPAAVDLPVELQLNDNGQLLWESFGDYAVPFDPTGERSGMFRGHITSINRYYNGGSWTPQENTPIEIELNVLPSVVVRSFTALGDNFVGDCKYPASNVISAVPYGLQVVAIGFRPLRWRYTLSPGFIQNGRPSTAPALIERPVRLYDGVNPNTHAVITEWDVVPTGSNGYQATITAEAEGADGLTRRVTFPFVVRDPETLYLVGKKEMAEIYEPEFVSGCVAGGPHGQKYNYTESTTRTVTNSFSTTQNEGWQQAYQNSFSTTRGRTDSQGGARSRNEGTTATDTRTDGAQDSNTWAFGDQTTHTMAAVIDMEAGNSAENGGRIGNVTNRDVTTNSDVTGQAGLGFASASSKLGNSLAEGGGTQFFSEFDSEDIRKLKAGVSGGTAEQASSSKSRLQGTHWADSTSAATSRGFTHTSTWNAAQNYSQAEAQSESTQENYSKAVANGFSVSTAEQLSRQSESWVYADQQGAWQRQLSRFTWRGVIVQYDLCGNAVEKGEVSFNSHQWGASMAISQEGVCPPPSQLPEAACLIEPCTGTP